MDERSPLTDCELSFTYCESRYLDQGYNLSQLAELCTEEVKDCLFDEETAKSDQLRPV